MRNFALKRNSMEGQIFKRKIYDAMLRWKHDSAGSTALMIEGPRRVGKSTIVRQFAQREYKSYIMIDFSKASDEEKGVFNNLSNIDFFFATLKLIEGTALYERESVIIFDEVQLFPVARQAIKHLVADVPMSKPIKSMSPSRRPDRQTFPIVAPRRRYATRLPANGRK